MVAEAMKIAIQLLIVTAFIWNLILCFIELTPQERKAYLEKRGMPFIQFDENITSGAKLGDFQVTYNPLSTEEISMAHEELIKAALNTGAQMLIDEMNTKLKLKKCVILSYKHGAGLGDGTDSGANARMVQIQVFDKAKAYPYEMVTTTYKIDSDDPARGWVQVGEPQGIGITAPALTSASPGLVHLHGNIPREYLEVHLREIYLVYDPSRIRSIPDILDTFKGREEMLLEELHKKYNIVATMQMNMQPQYAGQPQFASNNMAYMANPYTGQQQLSQLPMAQARYVHDSTSGATGASAPPPPLYKISTEQNLT
jgi:hypothetical protein